MRQKLFCVLWLALAITVPLIAEDSTQTVRFARGSSSSTFKGALKGYDGARYLVGAKAGQILTVSLKGSTSAYFNIWEPGKAPGKDTALYASGSAPAGNNTSVKLPAGGNYMVQVYLYRNEARRNRINPYTVIIGVK